MVVFPVPAQPSRERTLPRPREVRYRTASAAPARSADHQPESPLAGELIPFKGCFDQLDDLIRRTPGDLLVCLPNANRVVDFLWEALTRIQPRRPVLINRVTVRAMTGKYLSSVGRAFVEGSLRRPYGADAAGRGLDRAYSLLGTSLDEAEIALAFTLHDAPPPFRAAALVGPVHSIAC
jgi:hypothetical protein